MNNFGNMRSGVAQELNALAGKPGTATAAEKIMAVANRLGIRGIQDMQATTRMIYDSMPASGLAQYDFFAGCNARAFPFTNLSQNKLDVGEFMIVENITFQAFLCAVPPLATSTSSLTAISAGAYYQSDISFRVANQTTLKPITLGNIHPNWNYMSRHTANESLQLRTLLSIPSLQ